VTRSETQEDAQGRRRKIDVLGLPLRKDGRGARPATGAGFEAVGACVVTSIGGDRGQEEPGEEPSGRLARGGLPGVEPAQLGGLELEVRLFDALTSRRLRERAVELVREIAVGP